MLPGGGAGVTPVYLGSQNLLRGKERLDFQRHTERQSDILHTYFKLHHLQVIPDVLYSTQAQLFEPPYSTPLKMWNIPTNKHEPGKEKAEKRRKLFIAELIKSQPKARILYILK